MTKLSRSRKEQLISDVITRTLKKKDEKLENRKDAFARAIVQASLGKHAEAFDSLPDSFFPQISSLRIKSASSRTMYFKTPIKAPASFLSWIELGSSEENELASIVEEENALSKERYALYDELIKIVFSCNTVEQLHKLWPGSKEYIDIGPSVEHPLAPNCNKLLAMLKALKE